jgi:excisionase family DNA binding protein
VSERVLQRLKPLLSNKDNGKDRSNLLSVEDLAEYLDVEKDWVYSHIKEIPHFKVGRFPRFRKRDVDRWLEAQKAPQYTAPGRTAYNL